MNPNGDESASPIVDYGSADEALSAPSVVAAERVDWRQPVDDEPSAEADARDKPKSGHETCDKEQARGGEVSASDAGNPNSDVVESSAAVGDSLRRGDAAPVIPTPEREVVSEPAG